MRSTLKRYVFLVHRWLGVGMCVPVALWFASGIVMMYVEYPELTEEERLETLSPLPLEQVRIDPAAAVASLGERHPAIATLRLTTILGRPAYRLTLADGSATTIFADDGARLRGIDSVQAETAARLSGFAAAEAAPRHVATRDIDQWTVSAVLDRHRPLHKVEIGDAAGTALYVSSVTGEIVRDTTRRERFWNWLGSTIHWIYPWQLRRHADLWANVIIVLSVIGLVSIVSGAIVGWWRLRVRTPYRRGITPYRGTHKWHHLLGLGSLLFVLTFMFSGLMSMAPWGVFDNATSATAALERYVGMRVDSLPLDPALETLTPGTSVKEIAWAWIDGEPYLVMAHAATAQTAVGADGPWSAEALRARVEQAIPALLPDAPLLRTELIARYDDYYYSHHNRHRPLPVLRARFADPEGSWFHLDLRTGQVINRTTETDRVARWLYNGLHSLDFALLFQRRPLWDVIVVLLCAIGIAFSTTSVWIGWRRLRRPRSRVS